MQEPFEKLSPPPGGVEGLRKKLETFENRRSSFNRWGPPRVAAAAATVVSCLLIAGYSVLSLKAPISRDYGIFQRYMEVPPEEAVILVGSESAQLRLVQQPTANPAVKLYWIEDLKD